MSDDWGPWIEHDGKGCPLRLGTYISVEWQEWTGEVYGAEGILGESGDDLAAWDWSNFGRVRPFGTRTCRVIRYCIRKPRALQQLIDLVENLPAPAREREDA